MPITSFALGTWQVYRLKWKKGLIERYSENLRQPPIILPKDVGFERSLYEADLGIILLMNWIIGLFLLEDGFDMIKRCWLVHGLEMEN
jgi:hypothetical protein